MPQEIRTQLPEALHSLLLNESWRYKVMKGGRGSGKSWSCAIALLIHGMKKPSRFLCCREIQNSIKDSVHQLLRDRIETLGLQDFYKITESEIVGRNGTRFGFHGLRHNISNIKSWEGADIAWVEEGQVVSKRSWDVLLPTIRREDSEIWVTFNPELEEDETYQRFVVNKSQDCKLVHVTYEHNPWFPEVLRLEMENLKKQDFESYLNIWEGQCRKTIEGAIYADEMRKAMEEGRITSVPYQPARPVTAVFDKGWADFTSIWFVQFVGGEIYLIDFYQNQFKKTLHYIETMNERRYVYDRIYLPHDADNDDVDKERTMKRTMEDAYPNAKVTKLESPPGAVKAGIEAARNIFPICKFDKQKCADGLDCLRRYRYKLNTETGRWSKEPEHESPYCDGADAFRYIAMAVKPPKEDRRRVAQSRLKSSAWWVGGSKSTIAV